MRKPRHRDIQAARALSQALLPEVRYVKATSLEVRSQDTDNGTEIVVTGVPIVYDVGYEVFDKFGSFEERMERGAVKDVIEEDIVFMFDHGATNGFPLARTSSGTMTLEERADGLHMEARLDSRQQLARDVSVGIERGDIAGMSVTMAIGKTPNDQRWNSDMTQRTIYRLKKLSDISVVTWPASTQTSVEIAQRALYRAPAESMARITEMATEIRAGKVLSAATQTKLVDAFSAMHEVLGKSGYNFSDLFVDEEELDTENGGEIEEITPEVEPVSDDESVDAVDSVDDDARSLDLARAELEMLLLRRH